MQNKEGFCYTYSAKQQDEIKKLRQKYLPPQADKMEQLRRIDKSVTGRATAWSVGVGVVGTLIMGTGMSCALEWQMYAAGIILGGIGALLLAPAYAIYNAILKKEREKAAPQVLRLIEEIEKGS